VIAFDKINLINMLISIAKIINMLISLLEAVYFLHKMKRLLDIEKCNNKTD